VIFTGSGSEADALAIRGTVLAALTAAHGRWNAGRPQVITQATEHPGVLGSCDALNHLHGIEITVLPVDSRGLVRPGDLAAAITPRTVLVSVMHANNETGVIQPIARLAAVAHASGALFHTDAAQTVGKIPVSVDELGADLLTIAGHKMYAPKGIGALYIRDGVCLEPLVPGGGQERGLRAGTENVALAVALGTAADLARPDVTGSATGRLRERRDRLHRAIDQALPGRVHLNGHPEQRLPGTLNISIDGVTGDALLASAPGLAASTGSACHTGATEPSPVLHALGLPDQRARAAIRLSVGRWTTDDDIGHAAHLLAHAARTLSADAAP
jgi:cysteine desulfurase